jgi:hypothetical protein
VNDLVAMIDERRERFFRECGLAEQCNTQSVNLRSLQSRYQIKNRVAS